MWICRCVNWPYPRSSKMRKLPIIHVNVDLPVSGFAHVFFMQNAYKIQVRAGFRILNSTTLRSVEFSDFTQLQCSGCKENRMQRSRQIWHLTVNLAILLMKLIDLVITGRVNGGWGGGGGEWVPIDYWVCYYCWLTWLDLTLKRPGGGWINPPLDIFRDHSAARNFLTAPLADFLLSSLPHLMTPFSRKSGIPLRRCTTFYTSSSDQKWLKNVILCTKSMQMEFSHLIHKDMIIFTFIGWNQFILA